MSTQKPEDLTPVSSPRKRYTKRKEPRRLHSDTSDDEGGQHNAQVHVAVYLQFLFIALS